MIESAFGWLMLNLFSIMVLAFYSMEEMACVSFNRVKLQFFCSKGDKRALWLNYLLEHPSRLFGTTLIGVNVATVVGSECARQFHAALGLDPDWSASWQILLVIIFGELAPMFAARRYPEHVGLLGSPILYFSSRVFAPLIWVLGKISSAVNRLIGGKEADPDLFLSQDELQKILEEKDDESRETKEIGTLASNIFRLRNKSALHVMNPLNYNEMIPSNFTVGQVRKVLKHDISYIPVYNKVNRNIVGIAYIHDLIRAPDHKKVKDFTTPPWFIAEKTPAIQILKQFRRNNESLGIVIDVRGNAIGFISLDDILEEIFGESAYRMRRAKRTVIIDRTVSGEMTLAEFKHAFHMTLEGDLDDTLSDYLRRQFEHAPEEGESLLLPPYELIIKEMKLMDVKTVQVKTKS